jgi:hypothetical protein
MSNTYKLKPCPCGETFEKPFTDVFIDRKSEKTAEVICATCNLWRIVFDVGDLSIINNEVRSLALKAWNSAPREGIVLIPSLANETAAFKRLRGDK